MHGGAGPSTETVQGEGNSCIYFSTNLAKAKRFQHKSSLPPFANRRISQFACNVNNAKLPYVMFVDVFDVSPVCVWLGLAVGWGVRGGLEF